ncbi:MAG: [acyl-carrier-protein] S-malonyltransferase [Bdellovibrionaceae bacterium]|nr:[acyl-carrier-protein] S-malonyltransferase [Pseudobdellovibrionaceae bacterium]|tara:strand:- start:1907 stop:2893 length:987 start_codon:yes stop_codon:yes gene_type:complete
MIAFFPGQGSQQVGMGKELLTEFKIAQEIFEEASDAISVNLKKLCLEGPADVLMQTENTQPCLLVNSIAAFRVAQKELDFTPTHAAGHSLGEYSALVAIGALPLAQATRWVKARGQAMQEAVPSGEGSMAATLGMSPESVEELCKRATEKAKSDRKEHYSVEPIVEPANFNAPGQIVIAGSTDAIDVALELLKSGEITGKAKKLEVSAPFHCSLMKPARIRMEALFNEKGIEVNTPSHPYFANRTGRLTQEKGSILKLLGEQIDHPVLWEPSVHAMMNEGIDRGIEFGHGKVISGLIKRISKSAGKEFEVRSMGKPEDLKGIEEWLNK